VIWLHAEQTWRTDFKISHFCTFQTSVTLTFDQVIRHTVVIDLYLHTKFCSNRKILFVDGCCRTDTETIFIRGVDLKSHCWYNRWDFTCEVFVLMGLNLVLSVSCDAELSPQHSNVTQWSRHWQVRLLLHNCTNVSIGSLLCKQIFL